MITGCSGFIGRNFLQRSKVLEKFNITALYKTVAPSIDKNNNITFERVNLLNAKECKSIFKGFDVIVHLAGVMMTSSATENNPFKGINENLQIITNILEALSVQTPQKFIWMSSTTGYPLANKDLKEEDFFQREVPKRYEIVGSLYRLIETIVNKNLKDKCNLITLRPTGVFGEDDDFSPKSSHILPKIIRDSFLNSLPETIYAQKEEMRNWIYVEDLVGALDLLLTNIDESLVLNIGAKESTSMYDLYKIILKIFGLEKLHQINSDHNIYGEPLARNIDCSLSSKFLGKYNQTPLETGLIKTINWYKNQ